MQNLQQNQMREASYGTWTSPITATMTTRTDKSNRNCDIIVEGDFVYWTEPRPLEKGRTVIVRSAKGGSPQTMTPMGYDVRSKVHEYGGRAFTVQNSTIYFVHAKNQRLYVQESDQNPRPITSQGLRFAELLPYSQGILAVAEEHRNEKVFNFLVLIDPQTGAVTTLDDGHDFYAGLAVSPDGQHLAWLTWDHPHMPWDSTFLWVADLRNNQLVGKQMVAGGIDEALFQPQWSPQGVLYFISDRTGWWNIYRQQGSTVENVCPLEAEFGMPLWRLGTSTYAFTGRQDEMACTYQEQGVGKLALLNPSTKKLNPLSLGFTSYSQVVSSKGNLYLLMGTPDVCRRLFKLDLNSLKYTFLDEIEEFKIDSGYISLPESIAYPSAQGRTAYGYYYAPKNKDFQSPSRSLPPLIIMSHGGPTAAADPIFNIKVQYWTSRGFAVLDVNYGGSTGFGRAYRNLLKGQWGIVDVEDCSEGALYLTKQGKADPSKLIIRGASAGGYTTLAALAFTKTFAAGASYFGVADLELLVQDTHKFEALYLDQLIGPYPASKKLYEERAPLLHADRISCPVIFFQGALDKVVPLNQAEKMYDALKKKGLKTKLIVYDNEEHGFRQAENIQDSMEQELRFYQEVFHLEPTR